MWHLHISFTSPTVWVWTLHWWSVYGVFLKKKVNHLWLQSSVSPKTHIMSFSKHVSVYNSSVFLHIANIYASPACVCSVLCLWLQPLICLSTFEGNFHLAFYIFSKQSQTLKGKTGDWYYHTGNDIWSVYFSDVFKYINKEKHVTRKNNNIAFWGRKYKSS